MGSGVGGGLVGPLVFLLHFFSVLSEVPGKLKITDTHNRNGDINSLVNFLPLLTMIFIAIEVMPNIGKIIWRKYSISQLGNT